MESEECELMHGIESEMKWNERTKNRNEAKLILSDLLLQRSVFLRKVDEKANG